MSRPDRAVSYAVVLRIPGAPRTFIAATLARLSYGTLSLSLLLTVKAATGSFSVAGAAVGVFGIPGVLLPLKSRWIDRYGRRQVLGPLAVSYTTALLVIAGLDASGTAAPVPYLSVSAVAGLLTPPIGPVMRSIWAALTPVPAARQRAYALDAVVEEAVFTISPLLVGVLITTTRPVLALAVTAVLALVGALWSTAGSWSTRAASACRTDVRVAPGRYFTPERSRCTTLRSTSTQRWPASSPSRTTPTGKSGPTTSCARRRATPKL